MVIVQKKIPTQLLSPSLSMLPNNYFKKIPLRVYYSPCSPLNQRIRYSQRAASGGAGEEPGFQSQPVQRRGTATRQ